MERLSLDSFINKAKKIHGNKYDYSKVEYINSQTKVCIICPKHGEFWQIPNDHLKGFGCSSCSGLKKHTKESFIEKAKEVHGDKYDYSKVEYINSKTKVCIICPKHGEFWQKPNSHISNKQGCIKCFEEKRGYEIKYNLEIFIKKAKEVHGDKYDYSKVKYINSQTKVCIICPKHGEFWQTPREHLQGFNCQKCGSINRSKLLSLTNDKFIKKAKEVHGDRYDYSKINYVNYETKILIICPEHGEFWQMPREHLSGCGCPKCSVKNNINENKLFLYLCDNFQTPIIREKTFTWLKNKQKLRLDFYIPEFNIGIEYQGEQHFYPIAYFGGIKRFKQQLENDELKKKLCEEHGIKLLYFSYNKNFSNNVITDINKLKNAIINDK